MIEKHRNYHGKYLLTLVFASMLLTTLMLSTNNAFAMGQAPSTCPNRYDGPITSFMINNGSQTFDAMANPGVTFDENSVNRYNVTFVIHIQNSSSQGNSDPGTTWFSTSAPGYYAGHCVPSSGIGNIGPNQNITISTNWGRAGTASPLGGTQQVNVYTYFINSAVTFYVHWLSAPTPPNLQADAVSSSQINLSWTAPTSNGGSAITGYLIERSIDNGVTWSTIISNTDSTSTTYSDTGLQPNSTYTYKVSAINAIGTSSPSNTASATTMATLAVNAVDVLGNLINGIWIELHSADGSTIATGYTPVTFDVKQGTQYAVYASNYLHYVFLHWDDGSMSNHRNITPTGNAVITATYTP